MIRALTVVLACRRKAMVFEKKITQAPQICKSIALPQNSLRHSLGVITVSLVAMTTTAEWRLSDQWG